MATWNNGNCNRLDSSIHTDSMGLLYLWLTFLSNRISANILDILGFLSKNSPSSPRIHHLLNKPQYEFNWLHPLDHHVQIKGHDYNLCCNANATYFSFLMPKHVHNLKTWGKPSSVSPLTCPDPSDSSCYKLKSRQPFDCSFYPSNDQDSRAWSDFFVLLCDWKAKDHKCIKLESSIHKCRELWEPGWQHFDNAALLMSHICVCYHPNQQEQGGETFFFYHLSILELITLTCQKWQLGQSWLFHFFDKVLSMDPCSNVSF